MNEETRTVIQNIMLRAEQSASSIFEHASSLDADVDWLSLERDYGKLDGMNIVLKHIERELDRIDEEEALRYE